MEGLNSEHYIYRFSQTVHYTVHYTVHFTVQTVHYTVHYCTNCTLYCTNCTLYCTLLYKLTNTNFINVFIFIFILFFIRFSIILNHMHIWKTAVIKEVNTRSSSYLVEDFISLNFWKKNNFDGIRRSLRTQISLESSEIIIIFVVETDHQGEEFVFSKLGLL